MRYVTSIERLAKVEGRQYLLNALSFALELKFGEAGLALAEDLKTVPDMEQLSAILEQIRSAMTVAEVREKLASNE